MKNTAINPTIWQPISYSAYRAEKSNRKKRQTSLFNSLRNYKPFKDFYSESTDFTNTFNV
ncbi:hypothetical protein ADIWIN_1164 [Winogradskyella psychrotolerans RS-3]|uniref:Uncharacterized protein n=1 Tax=Winogradskyella psychrotolerans RS-3 TaxID=641526 RepID=S7X439_9FLAO|nr:hypothetical protein [Winogradskyella psychrotolerans]EPR73804.1 hypothetical protein ADIWIN_1164 [Winogradskyella psychrotolerans RS-3]